MAEPHLREAAMQEALQSKANLLIGMPGTGKTMLCKAVATALPKFPFRGRSDS